MIDYKKIEEAARNYCNNRYPDSQDAPFIAEWFRHGAKWARQEFLKDLWHPVIEEPRKDVSIIVETHNDKNMFYYAWNRWQDNFYPSWTDAVLCSRVSRWLYIDDLLPKKEVSNERA